MNQYAKPQISVSVDCVADLRSDTVTKPCEGMRKAISEAAVGDDVYGEDPCVNRLEQELAKMLGKEAGLFLSSGTQSNLSAIMAHCGRGEEAIVGKNYHIFIDEAAGASVLAGVALFPIAVQKDGAVSADAVRAAIKEDDYHCPVSRLLCLENTVHGKPVSLAKLNAAGDVARKFGLNVHLDGARFFNAVTALACQPRELADVADSVSICLSKGLGAPVGTVLVGSEELVARARRHRKILGGGTRQAGLLAAAGLYALEHNIDRLGEDHARAARLAKALKEIGSGTVETSTNMVFFTPSDQNHAGLHTHLGRHGIRIGGQQPSIRMVVHRDINDINLDAVISGFRSYYG